MICDKGGIYVIANYCRNSDVSLLENHNEKDEILKEIENTIIIAKLFGYNDCFFSCGTNLDCYSEYFICKNIDNYFLQISFERLNKDGRKRIHIIYPSDWVQKFKNNSEVFGVSHIIEESEKYLTKIKEIRKYF